MTGTIPTFVGSGNSNITLSVLTTASATRFFPICTCYSFVRTTEAHAQIITRAAGEFSRLGVRVVGSTWLTDATLRFRIDTGGGGANGNNVATITGGASGWFEDATPHTDTVADGNKICTSITTGTGAGKTMSINGMGVKFYADTGAAAYYGYAARGANLGTQGLLLGTASTTYDTPIGGGTVSGSGYQTTETANFRHKLRGGGVLSHIHTYAVANARGTDTTFKIRINAGAANGTITVTASTTGFFEDVTNSDTINAADVAVWVWVTGTGTGTLDIATAAGRFIPTTSTHDILACSIANDASGSTSVTNYYPVVGYAVRNITEASIQIPVTFSTTLTFLRCYVTTGQVGALTLDLHVNGSTVNNTVTITSTSTGIFEDLTGMDTVADGAMLSYSHGAMVSVSGFYIQWFGLTSNPGSGITPGNGSEVHHYNTVILG